MFASTSLVLTNMHSWTQSNPVVVLLMCCRYAEVLEALPHVLVLMETRLWHLTEALARHMAACFEASQRPLPPWRSASSMVSKWWVVQPELFCQVLCVAWLFASRARLSWPAQGYRVTATPTSMLGQYSTNLLSTNAMRCRLPANYVDVMVENGTTPQELQRKVATMPGH